jgi:hypothetical protein
MQDTIRHEKGIGFLAKADAGCWTLISYPSLSMTPEQSPHWYLKKYGQGEIHGPVPFHQIQEWANAAQINPQDTISSDQRIWIKAPMVAGLHMDWLIEVGDNRLYGPTTCSALLEFFHMGEITPESLIINSRTAETMPLSKAPFFEGSNNSRLSNTGNKDPLRERIKKLEAELLAKKMELRDACTAMAKLEARITELESRG